MWRVLGNLASGVVNSRKLGGLEGIKRGPELLRPGPALHPATTFIGLTPPSRCWSERVISALLAGVLCVAP